MSNYQNVMFFYQSRESHDSKNDWRPSRGRRDDPIQLGKVIRGETGQCVTFPWEGFLFFD